MIESYGYQIDPKKIPRHIAIIMDGNGRWAKREKVSRIKGHSQGLLTLKKIISACEVLQVPVLSVYAFSTENWKRSKMEVSNLFKLFEEFVNNELDEIMRKQIKVVHSGLKSRFSKTVTKLINRLEEETKDNTKAILNIGIDYSGRSEIIEMMKNAVTLYKENPYKIDKIDENFVSNLAFNPEVGNVELLIRTSGEMRISNYFLWQLAYSELYFTETLWPDFEEKELSKAVFDYQNRERRFGGR